MYSPSVQGVPHFSPNDCWTWAQALLQSCTDKWVWIMMADSPKIINTIFSERFLILCIVSILSLIPLHHLILLHYTALSHVVLNQSGSWLTFKSNLIKLVFAAHESGIDHKAEILL